MRSMIICMCMYGEIKMDVECNQWNCVYNQSGRCQADYLEIVTDRGIPICITEMMK